MSDEHRTSSGISITPDRDEVAPYRRDRRAEPPRQTHFNGLLVFVIALMAIIMGIGGYALYEANQLLLAGQKNVEDLDARLAATGTDVSKTLQSMQGQLKSAEHEIRKLWDVSNKRNKSLIRANEKGLANVKKQLADFLTTYSNLEKDLKGVKSLSEEAVAQVEDMQTRSMLTEGQIQDQTDQLTATKRQVVILEKQLKEINEAILAIDQHRIQVNQDLRDLRERLQLQGGD